MDYACEVVVNAVVSDIVGRIISRAMDNFLRPSSLAGTRDAHRLHLEQLLHSISSAVAEAQGRDITNNLELLAQLLALIDAKFRALFALEFIELEDIVKKNAALNGDDEAGDDSVVSTEGKRSLALCSTFKAAKRARLTITSLIRACGDGDGAMTEKKLAAAVEELEALIRNGIRESFIQLVQGYPRRSGVPRPLTTTLYMDRCVFGRHVEKERIVTFLLQPVPRDTGLSSLAVVGTPKVGKETLVRHVCDDERVRGHFARVEWFECREVLGAGGRNTTEWNSGLPEYLVGVRRILDEPRFGAAGRSLLVFQNARPVDDEEAAWAALLATSKLAEGSKLLFTCWDNTNIAWKIGTAEPVVLRPLQEEEYWYYFKAFAFAGADPRDHPRMAAVGREICHHLERTFLDARVLGPLLRVNFNVRFWRRVLATAIGVRCRKKHLAIIDVLLDLLLPIRAGVHWDNFGPTQTPPELTLQDVLSASGPSSSSFGTSCLGDGDTGEVVIKLYKETLYMDHWYRITFRKNECKHMCTCTNNEVASPPAPPLHVGTSAVP